MRPTKINLSKLVLDLFYLILNSEICSYIKFVETFKSLLIVIVTNCNFETKFVIKFIRLSPVFTEILGKLIKWFMSLKKIT